MNNTTRDLRSLSEDLCPAAAQLITDLRTNLNGRVVCSPQEVEKVLRRSLDIPSYRGVLAFNAAGAPIGYVGSNDRFAIYAGGDFLQITELYVDPGARRAGVAKTLMRDAFDYAKGRGMRSVEISVPRAETHPGTHAFYESLGAKVSGPRMFLDLENFK